MRTPIRSIPYAAVSPSNLFVLILLLTKRATDGLSAKSRDTDECRSQSDAIGANYQGKLNVAYDGTECQPWNKHPHFYRFHWTEERVEREKNYCRNPDEDIFGPWCVVHKTTFKYCNVPRCAKDVGCYEGNGEDYNGNQDRTSQGIPCKIWRHTTDAPTNGKAFRYRLHQNETHSTVMQPNDIRLDTFKSCRNPGGSMKRPWCYTIGARAAEREKQYCDIPLCSEPSVLGYPLLTKESTCPQGFIQQSQSLSYQKEKTLQVPYCVAPERVLHPDRHRLQYSSFNNFCLYLISSSNQCPSGFRSKQRIKPNFRDVTHISGPSAWRTPTGNLAHFILCCSEPEYFRNETREPYIMLEKISRYKRISRHILHRPRQRSIVEDIMWQLPPLLHEKIIGAPFPRIISKSDLRTSTGTSPNPSSSNALENLPWTSARFASVGRCFAVPNMTRMLIRNMPEAESLLTMPFTMVLTIGEEYLCEYHAIQHSAEVVDDRDEDLANVPISTKLVLLVDEPECPTGFRAINSTRQLLLILGPGSHLCESLKTSADPPSATRHGYCLIVVPDDKELKSDSALGHPTKFECPKDFRPNELHFFTPESRLLLCCTGQENHTLSDEQDVEDSEKVDRLASPLQAPYRISVPFSVIRNGEQCPEFYVDKVKLHSESFVRAVMIRTINKLELIGLDNGVQPFEHHGINLCKYFNPETKLGVKSITYDCDGLGHRSTMAFNGATCGFEINETTSFPPGKYCLLQLSAVCPTGFTHRGGVVRLGHNFQSLGSTCCRNEESIGAIRFPVKFEAPFKLPAVHRPCQAIEGFNVDAELHHCVYYPQGSTLQALLVWPRIVGLANNQSGTLSAPLHCATLPRKKRQLQRSQIGRLTTLFFNIMQDQWLIYKRPRWTTKVLDTGDVCFAEVPWNLLPRSDVPGETYCIFSFGTCPKPDFETLGTSTYMNTVLCCTLSGPRAFIHDHQSDGQHLRTLRYFVTLGHPLPEDKAKLRGTVGYTVLFRVPTNQSAESDEASEVNGCPRFVNLKVYRKVAEGIPAPAPLDVALSSQLTGLFNVTHMDSETFTRRTGIWAEDGKVYLIYCEYYSNKSEKADTDSTEWPTANFALPKSLANCPKNSKQTVVGHRQDQSGFHYSRPIHLDGNYLQGEKSVWLEYCVFTSDAAEPTTYGMRDELPQGHYCVLRVRGSCPWGFTDGLLTVIEGPESINKNSNMAEPERVPDYSGHTTETSPLDIDRERLQIKDNTMKIDRLNYHFCCRTDSPSVDSPIEGFPSDSGPFFLYRVGDKCQQIKDMRVTEEYICMDTPNPNGDPSWWNVNRNQTWMPYRVQGLTPARIPYHVGCDVQIHLCYYERDIPHVDNDTIPIHNSGSWPVGSYSLPSVHRSDTEEACPPGFTHHHASLINQQFVFFDLEIIPTSLGPYFLELIGHNLSALNVHFCDRDQPKSKEENPNSDEEAAMQWPRGYYCVISTAPKNHCPPGLHRHTRALAELCCRTDVATDPTPVNWPFVGDFFLFGGEKCLPIRDAHVERYLVRLTPADTPKRQPEWDILCHYMPIEWIEGETHWPDGDFMLPIGRRSGLRTSMTTIIQYEGQLSQDHIPVGSNRTAEGFDEIPRPYECPDTFQRAHFTFVSKTAERHRVPDGDQTKVYNLVGMTAMEFCVRENYTETKSTLKPWPAGDYCVFTMNKECPVGMQASKEFPLKIPRFILKSVDLVDKYGNKLENKHWHEEAQNQVVYFMQCCREDKRLLLRLPPSTDGFYLVSSAGLCSIIPGTLLDREKVTSYLTSPLANKPSTMPSDRDLLLYREMVAQREGVMYLCYYHPGKGLDYLSALDTAPLSTTLNVTEKDLDSMAVMCGCAENAFCLPHRQAECVCKPGYFGDGRHMCRAITPLTDECADLCDPAAVCKERLDMELRRRRNLLTHTCVCRSGYVGDGFSCQPSCATRECPAFSRCVHNAVYGTVNCECIDGTIASEDRCHFDIYKSLQQEKDLPQSLIHYDHCFSEETQNALRLLTPKRYFYMFETDKLLKTCDEVKTHLVVLMEPLTTKKLQLATSSSPVQLITENRTVVEVYLQNDTWVIDGHIAQRSPIRFVNGELFILSAPLKQTPAVTNTSAYYIAATITSLAVLIVIAVVVYFAVIRRRTLRWPQIRRRTFSRRTFWRPQTEGVLVEETDTEE